MHYDNEDRRLGMVLRTTIILRRKFDRETPETLLLMAEARMGTIEDDDVRTDMWAVVRYMKNNNGFLIGVGDLDVGKRAEKAYLLNDSFGN